MPEAAPDNRRIVTCDEWACDSGPCWTPARWMIATSAEVPPRCPNRVQLADPQAQLPAELRRREYFLTPAARELLGTLPHGGDEAQICAKLRAGELTLLENRAQQAIRHSSTPRPQRPDEPIRPVPTPVKQSWITIRVVLDQTGEPIPNVALKIRLPDGRIDERRTRADGAVGIYEIDPGVCDVEGVFDPDAIRLDDSLDFVGMGEQPIDPLEDGQQPPPPLPRKPRWWLMEIEEHKVRTGETLDSLAQQNNLTWQQLAMFNWDTNVPKEINEHLRDKVGCTKKTADGHNYMFNDADDPGVVFVPTKWEKKGLATEQVHTIRVRTLGYGQKAYLAVQIFFHETAIENLQVEFFKANPDDSAGEKIGETVTTNNDGVARLEDRAVDIGSYICRIENQPDALITSVHSLDEPLKLALPIGRPLFEYDARADGDEDQAVGPDTEPEEQASD
ncbi:MAG: LysM domain-containing protein [Planctomycetota bacterium]|nr:MAG: LysM domain-containing protein [Planctomycetota bacterium]